MLDSLEGKRGIVRYKPPLPAIEGLFGKPTVINNVISLASVPIIIAKGGEYYRDFGVGTSRGTLAFQLAGNIKQGGLVEKAFGVTARELIEDFGGGTLSGRPVRAVQFGGPLGAYLPESKLDTQMDYEAFIKEEAMVGHGGIVVFDDTVDMAKQARFAMEFCAIEIVRQVHALPHRIGARRRGDRPHRRRRRPRREHRAVEGSVRDHDRRIAVRHGRADADAGHERAQPFPRRLQPPGARRGRRMTEQCEATL